LLVGIGLATRCVANMIITPRLHKIEHLMPALRWLSFASFFFVMFHFFATDSFWLMALATVLFNLCFGPIVPLSDAITNYYTRIKMIDYGRTRLWGSVSFIVGSTVVGYLTAEFGSEMILYTAAAGMLCTILFAMRSIQPMPKTLEKDAMCRPKLGEILKDISVVKFLALVALIQGSHAAYYGFSVIYWKEVGYAEDTIGYLWSLGVVAEVAVFAFSKKLFIGWSLRRLFVVASVGAAIRWGLTASTTALSGLIVVQLLHGVTFCLAHIAAVQYIQHSKTNRMVALQALYNAIPLGAVIAFLTALCGWGYEYWRANVFWVMAVMGILALFIHVEPDRGQCSVMDTEAQN